MTEQRDPDRITRAWLDLMPSEAPDRAIAAVLQAVETAPQLRRLPRPASWRLPSMNKISVMTAAVVVVAAGITSTVLLTSDRARDVGRPSAVPLAATASPAVQRGEGSIVGRWLSGPRSGIPGLGDTEASYLRISPTALAFGGRTATREGEGLGSAIEVLGDELVVRTIQGVGDCATNEAGRYRWSLSSNEKILDIQVITDECADRPNGLTGSWLRAACDGMVVPCLGELPPGRYRSWALSIEADSVTPTSTYGALEYEVRSGWSNTNEWTAGYWLEPTDWYREFVAGLDGPDTGDRRISTGIYVMARPGAVTVEDGCSRTLDKDVARTARDLAEWVARHPALDASEPSPIQVGDLDGWAVEAALDPAWAGGCPDPDDLANVVLFRAQHAGLPTTEYDWGIADGGRDRYIFLDGPGEPILIDVAASEDDFDAFVPSAMEVVETFQFRQ